MATSSNCKTGKRLNLEMLAIWGFVVLSFAALAFAGYVVWLRCLILLIRPA
jgi:hypothetical protein